jgi:hypothetical protein
MQLFDSYSVLKVTLSKERCSFLTSKENSLGYWSENKFIFERETVIEIHGIHMRIKQYDFLK